MINNFIGRGGRPSRIAPAPPPPPPRNYHIVFPRQPANLNNIDDVEAYIINIVGPLRASLSAYLETGNNTYLHMFRTNVRELFRLTLDLRGNAIIRDRLIYVRNDFISLYNRFQNMINSVNADIRMRATVLSSTVNTFITILNNAFSVRVPSRIEPPRYSDVFPNIHTPSGTPPRTPSTNPPDYNF